MIENSCIYCGTATDLSESDIIPDALTNARITNKNVCRVAHNNKFSDLFESKVIAALSFITNELDIKSSKSKRYATYDATVTVDGKSYKTSLQNDKAIFDGRVMKSTDKTNIIASYETIAKIAKGESSVQSIDVNQLEIEKTVSINTSIYFDESMFRMIAKIAYEWYCAKNDVLGYHREFENIVSYITTGTGDCPVSIIQSDDLYHYLSKQLNLGSHALFAFESKNGQIELVVSLFGILMYRVVVATARPEFCAKNFLFVELRTDSSRIEVEHESLSAAEEYFFECFNPEKCVKGATINGLTFMIPKMSEGLTNIPIYPFIFNMVKCFDEIRNDTQSPNETINQILFTQLQQITQASLLHKKSIKRFVNDYFCAGHEPIKLNPSTSNKKVTFLFYAVFVVGQSDVKTLDDSLFQRLMKEKFSLNGNNDITVTDELETQIKKDMLDTPGYSDILERGVKIIKEWA